MKKIISLLIALTLIMSLCTSVFAAGNKNRNGAPGEVKDKIVSKVKSRAEYISELNTLTKQMKDKNKETKKLRVELKKSVNKLKKILVNLRENTEDITQEQIDEISSMLQTFKQIRHEFGTNHKDKIKNNIPKLRSNKKDRDIESVKKTFDEIFEEQGLRNENLNKLIEKISLLIEKYTSSSQSSKSSSTISSSLTQSSDVTQSLS